MRIRCPQCEQALEVSEEGAHHEVSCTTCGGTVIVAITMSDATVVRDRGSTDSDISEPVSLAGEGTQVLPVGSTANKSLSDSGLGPLHAERPAPGRPFGDYQLEEEIARGGMGVVFKATQIALNRPVALKMILASNLAGAAEVHRFRSEAESAAKLEHPGIVPIYEVGEYQGQHFFSMGLVEGGTLSDLVRDGAVAGRRACELVKQVAEAVQYAHSRNIVHRDLKPANVLLDLDGQPKITDFGLAKNVEEDSGLTATGAIMGTPGFMAPEQAAGTLDEVGPLADVYALGGILYFLITSRAPFSGANLIETIQQVLTDPPKPPDRLNPRIDKDLSVICLKALEKEPAKRHPSAAQLVDDLNRYLRGEPIHARPVGRAERALKWVRRHPLVAALSAGTAGLLIALLLGGWWYQEQLAQSLAENKEERATATRRLYESLESEVDSLVSMRPEGFGARAWQLIDQARQLDTPVVDKQRLRQLAVSSLGHASSRAPIAFRELGAEVTAADVTPDDRYLFVGLEDGQVVVIDLLNRVVVHRFQEHGDAVVRVNAGNSRRVLTQTALCREVCVWQSRDDKVWTLAERHNGHSETAEDVEEWTEPFFDIVVTPDSTKVVGFAPLAAKEVTDVAVSTPGGLVTSLSTSKILKESDEPPVFAVRPRAPADRTEEHFTRFPGVTANFKHYAVSSSHLVVGYDGGEGMPAIEMKNDARTGGHSQDTLVICNLNTGRIERVLRTECGNLFKVAISGDGQFVACSGTQNFQVFRRATGERLAQVSDLGFCDVRSFIGDNGDVLVTNAEHWIWYSVRDQRTVTRFPKGNDYRQLTFSTTGRQLLRSGNEGVEVIDVAPAERRQIAAHSLFTHSVRFSPDGRLLGSSGRDEFVRIWSAATLEKLLELPGSWFAFSPDGELLATIDEGGMRLWNLKDGSLASDTYPVNPYHTLEIDFSPDGKLLVWTGNVYHKGIRVWRVERASAAPIESAVGSKPRKLTLVYVDGEGFHDSCWSPSGRRLAYRVADKTRVYDFERQEKVAEIEAPLLTKGARFVDENRLATAIGAEHREGSMPASHVVLWDLPSQRQLERRGLRPAFPVASSPDKRSLACRNHLFQSDELKQLFTLPFWYKTSIDADWSPDGKRIAYGFANGMLVIWDLSEVHDQLSQLGLEWQRPGFGEVEELPSLSNILSRKFIESDVEEVRNWDSRFGQLLSLAASDDTLPNTLTQEIQWLVGHIPLSRSRPFQQMPTRPATRLRMMEQLAEELKQRGEFDATARLLRGAVEFASQLAEPDPAYELVMSSLYHRLGDLYQFQFQDKLNEAAEAYAAEERSLGKARQAGASIPPYRLYWLDHNRALAAEKLGMRATAMAHLEQAVAYAEANPNAVAKERLRESYLLLINWLQAENRPDDVRQMIQRARAQGVLTNEDDL